MTPFPIELMHMIVRCLDPADIANFRLSCWQFSEIGLEYLFEDAVAYLHHRSLLRLSELASHQAASQAVRSLRLDIDGLMDPVLSNEEHVAKAEQSEIRMQEINELLIRKNLAKKGLVRPRPKRNLQEEYEVYRATAITQDVILRNKIHHNVWTFALSKLSNLESISLTSQISYHNSPWDAHSLGAHLGEISDPLGVSDLNALLKAVVKSETRLKELEVGYISWRFFPQFSVSDLSHVLPSLSHLTTLVLQITTSLGITEVQELREELAGITEEGGRDEFEFEGLEATECSEAMEDGHLRRFIKALPNLEKLSVTFDYRDEDGTCGASFDDIFDKNGTWPRFQYLELSTVLIQSSEFLSFAAKHHHTFRELVLEGITLDSSWITFLTTIQQTMNLQDADVSGNLWGQTEPYAEHWQIWPDLRDSLWPELKEFLIEGGTCPLNHENMALGYGAL
ncbi:hypothetical protein BT63DRAFT_421603 [Microthyrium microscopicum]|uniref:F-box domain-containing protein n=1 Tax=Microthyrium microscopicum TaxID=703497 RepID=A0A6A6URA2_9PEZI|nr:hypothetical protein BT63DRAFT_421603 [Microthyrium microscopicum]